MTDDERFVVPSERHVERLSGEGKRGETRTSLRSRLTLAFLPDAVFADERECRLLLAVALDEGARVPVLATSEGERRSARDAAARKQLDLFGGAATGGADEAGITSQERDPMLEALRKRGGASWSKMVDALGTSIGALRARMVSTRELLTVAKHAKGLTGSRARTLATAMAALDARLREANVEDQRRLGPRLAEALAAAPLEQLVSVLGATRLRAHAIFAWEPADMAWWRVLDERLTPLGGYARIVLPTFDRPLEGTRERDPLEILTDEIARGLDAPPEHEAIDPVLGDLTFARRDAPLPSSERVALARVDGPVTQARFARDVVQRALDAGGSLERMAIALTISDERTLAPLRRALESSGIVFFEARGAPASEAPVVMAAFDALAMANTLERNAVARLLASGFVDGAALAPDDADRASVVRALDRISKQLASNATAAGEDAKVRLLRTATAGATHAGDPASAAQARELEATMAKSFATLVFRDRDEATRLEHVHHARSVWSALGLGRRAGRGGLRAFARDAAPQDLMRAERAAIARDARAWDTLLAILDRYEATLLRTGGSSGPQVSVDVFRKELCGWLDESTSRPGAGRAGAVRLTRLADVAGDDLDLLVVLDANEGLLPRDEASDALVTDALWSALARVASRRDGSSLTAPNSELRRARELTQLASAAHGAKSVVLVSLREDASGAPLAPSPVITALERAGIVASTGAMEQPAAPLDAALAVRVLRERQREGFFLDPARPLTDVVGGLSPPASARPLLTYATGGATRPLAITSLERFARCAFMGYAHTILQVREAERHDELPDAREEGSVVHDALAAAFVATRQEWPRRPRNAALILSVGLEATKSVLEKWQGHAPLRTIHRLRVQDTVRAVLLAAIEDEDWDFALAEQPFGARNEDAWPPYVLQAGDERLTLRGTIDRLDVARGGHAQRVVDYKRSKNTVRAAFAALGDTALQVPLYARVAERTRSLPTTGTYLPFQPRDVRDAKMSPKAQKRMDDLLIPEEASAPPPIDRRALELVVLARRGSFAPLPASESECLYCAVSGGCRKPRFAMAPVDEDEGEIG